LLAHAKQQIHERDAALSADHANLARAEQVVQELEKGISLLRAQEASLDSRIVELGAEARRYRETLEAILSSTFWKLTTPIRWLRHPTRALLGKD